MVNTKSFKHFGSSKFIIKFSSQNLHENTTIPTKLVSALFLIPLFVARSLVLPAFQLFSCNWLLVKSVGAVEPNRKRDPCRSHDANQLVENFKMIFDLKQAFIVRIYDENKGWESTTTGVYNI